jgi:hypothetical protein
MPLAALEVRSIGHGVAPGASANVRLPCLRDAMLCDDHPRVLDQALDRCLGIGATSGADTVSGLMSGPTGSLPAAALARSTKVHA